MAYSPTLSTRMWNCSTVSCSAVLLGNFLDIGCDGKSRIRFEAKRLLGSLAKRFLHEIFRTLERHFRAPVSAKSFGDGKACCKNCAVQRGLTARFTKDKGLIANCDQTESEVRNKKKD